jgi:uncharacterized membrane protein
MDTTAPRPAAQADIDAAQRAARGTLHNLVNSFRTRALSGLILALPIAVTFWIVYQLYVTFRRFALDPLAGLVRSLIGRETFETLPAWWDYFVAPFCAIVLVILALYVLGHFARSRLHRAVDWTMLRLPVVTVIYKTARNVFQALDPRGDGLGFKRVVLVEFPHPGMKALAFVTNALRDPATGRTILCVCVLTGVVPPAGFTLFVPEDEVVELDWTVNQTLQAIVSGGITAPEVIAYSRERDG